MEYKSPLSCEIMFYKDQLDEHSGNCQNLWKTFGKILNNKKSSSHIVNHIKINNKKVSDSNQIAQEFNKYFSSIGENLAENFENTNSSHCLGCFLSSYHLTTEKEGNSKSGPAI